MAPDGGGMMHAKPLKYVALNIAAATTELVKGILILIVYGSFRGIEKIRNIL